MLLYATLRYFTLLYATLRYSTLLYATLRYSTLLYAALLYATLLYSTIRYSRNLLTTVSYRHESSLVIVAAHFFMSIDNKNELCNYTRYCFYYCADFLRFFYNCSSSMCPAMLWSSSKFMASNSKLTHKSRKFYLYMNVGRREGQVIAKVAQMQNWTLSHGFYYMVQRYTGSTETIGGPCSKWWWYFGVHLHATQPNPSHHSALVS
jgi:hypothetical protein